MSLESVIQLEKNKPIFSAIKKLDILSSLSLFNPLIAGTFPLGINTANSDVDILISGSNLAYIKDYLIQQFSMNDKFQLNEISVFNEPTVLASFDFDGITFEIFCQRIESVRQSGYLHFLIEERLLKIGGQDFLEKIKDLRNQGLKTEPAFAKALNLQGDPYAQLLNLQNLSEEQLKLLMKPKR
jgi:hypothetical protein